MGYFASTSQGALSGAGTGAAIGSLFGPGYGTAIGGAAGGIIGGIGGWFGAKATEDKKKAVGQARLRLEELARSQRMEREANLQKAMGFFDPVQAEMDRLYGRRG